MDTGRVGVWMASIRPARPQFYMNTCIELKDLPFPVKVEQNARGRFRVTYGQQVKRDLGYEAAAKEFGLCVFHALACAGKIEPEDT